MAVTGRRPQGNRFAQNPAYRRASHFYSDGGQQMRAVARGLMSEPVLLLLDEPSLGLAPKVIEEFAALDKLRNEGLTVLLVDQMAALALSLADRAYVLASGRVVAEGTAQSLLADGSLAQAYLGGGTN